MQPRASAALSRIPLTWLNRLNLTGAGCSPLLSLPSDCYTCEKCHAAGWQRFCTAGLRPHGVFEGITGACLATWLKDVDRPRERFCRGRCVLESRLWCKTLVLMFAGTSTAIDAKATALPALCRPTDFQHSVVSPPRDAMSCLSAAADVATAVDILRAAIESGDDITIYFGQWTNLQQRMLTQAVADSSGVSEPSHEEELLLCRR